MDKLDKIVKGVLNTKRIQKRWLRIAAMLSVFVFLGVVWRLTVPVITMTAEPICNMEEHTHSEDCYSELLSCGMEESDEHTHTDECYTTVLTCETEEHVHSESCYPEEEAEEQKLVTVTFVIGDETYAEHITTDKDVYQLFADEDRTQLDENETIGLAQLDNTEIYQLDGIGTLYSVQIPEGTTLEENGLLLPNLTVDNSDDDTVKFLETYEWVQEEEILNEQTVIDTDTFFELKLTEDPEAEQEETEAEEEASEEADDQQPTEEQDNDESSEDEQSAQDQEDDEKAEDEQKASDEKQSEGAAEEEKDGKEELDETLPMIDLNDPEEGTGNETGKLETATITFHQIDPTDEEQSTTQTLVVENGQAIGDQIPQGESYSGYSFIGWYYAESEIAIPLTIDTVVQGDMTVTAKYTKVASSRTRNARRAPQKAPSSNSNNTVSVETNGNTTTLRITVAEGGTLKAEDFIINGVNYGDSTKYTWKDGSGRTVDLSSILGSNLEEITMTLTNTATTLPSSGGVEKTVTFNTSGDTTTITIQMNEGDVLTAADFVYNGIDYTQYTWKRTDTGEGVRLQDLIGVPMTQALLNQIATYEYKDEDTSGSGTQTTTGNINFFVCIDKEWVRVDGEAKTMQLRSMNIIQNGETSASATYVISASQLESVLGTYGFKAEDLEAGLTMFRHSGLIDSPDGNTLAWGDRRPFEYDGITYVQLLRVTQGTDCNLYYTPGEAKQSGNVAPEFSNLSLKHMTHTGDSDDDSGSLFNNTLRKLTVKNAEGTSFSSLPFEQYVLDGFADQTITLPQLEDGYMWGYEGTSTINNGVIGTIIDSNSSTVTYQLTRNGTQSSVGFSRSIVPKKVEEAAGSGEIRLFVSKNGSWEQVGTISGDKIYSIPQTTTSGAVPLERLTYGVSADTLAEYLGDYGFEASDLEIGSGMFRHTGTGGTSIWNDRTAFYYNGKVYVPLLDSSPSADLYYTPANTESTNGGVNRDELAEDNTFYSITATNNNPGTYGGSSSDNKTVYALRGSTGSIQLSKLNDNYFWSVDNSLADNGVVSGNNVTYSFENITENKSLAPRQKGTEQSSHAFNTEFYISIDHAWVKVAEQSMTADWAYNYDEHGVVNGTFGFTAEQLYEIYKDYGFETSDVIPGRPTFFHKSSRNNESALWGDRSTFQYLDDVYVPIFNNTAAGTTGNLQIYYMPNEDTPTSYTLSNRQVPQDATTKNTFYSIKINDYNNVLGGSYDGSSVAYFKSNADGSAVEGTITLPKLGNTHYWTAENGANLGLGTDNGDGTVTYTLSNVTGPTVVTPVAVEQVTDKRVRFFVFSDETDYPNFNLYEVDPYHDTVNNIRGDLVEGMIKTIAVDKDGIATEVYAIPASAVAEKYKDYGITLDDIKVGESLIQRTLAGDATLRSELPAFTFADQTYVPIRKVTEGSGDSDWQYVNAWLLPNDTTPGDPVSPYYTNSLENKYYRVIASNSDNIPYENPSAQLPEVQHVLTGNTATVVLPKLADDSSFWRVQGAVVTNTTDNGDGTVTYELGEITDTIHISPGELGGEEEKKVRFWVSIDEEWKLIDDAPKDVYVYVDPTNSHSYIEMSVLEDVYEPYGFKSSDIGTRTPFRYTNGSPEWMYYLPTQNLNGVNYQEIQDDTRWKVSDVYYLPNDTTSDTNSRLDGTGEVKIENTFYSITVEDPLGVSGYTEDQLPEAQYVKRGATTTVTLPPLSDGRTWVATGMALDGGAVLNADGSITYTLANVDKKTVIRPSNNANTYSIKYEIAPDYSEVYNHGNDVDEEQVWDLDTLPTVNGTRSLTLEFDSSVLDRHTVLTPSDNYAQTTKNFSVNANKGLQRYTYTFAGWKVNGDPDVILEPGANLRGQDIAQYANEHGEVVLTPKWSITSEPTSEGKTIESVGFYVQINSVIHDRDSDNQNPELYTWNKDYSDSVYSTAVINGKYISSTDQDVNNQRVIAPENASDTGINADIAIRKLASEGHTGTDYRNGNPVTVSLADFPSDEEVLANLRNWSLRDPEGYHKNLKVDGELIPLDQLNAKNFTIRWYVFKYDASNGWHIDGLLVPKKGRITVTKTFMGDKETIENIISNKSGLTNDYQIVLDSNRDDEDDTILTLNGENGTLAPQDEGTDASKYTYTWVVELNQLTDYTINEVNYEGGSDVSTNARYSITNSENDNDTNGMQPYTGNIQARAFAYNTDQYYHSYQTIAMENEYMKAGNVVVRKVDARTGQGMAGVSFVSYDTNGDPITYYLKDGVYYTANPGGAQQVDSVVTDENGMIYFDNSQEFRDKHSNFTLREQELEGYTPISDINLTIGANNTLQAVGNLPDGVTLTHTTIGSNSVSTLNITNQPKTTRLVVEKKWSKPEEEQQVTVALVKDGNRLDSMTKVLNADNNWTAAWEDIPLYENGRQIEYAVQETVIGADPMTAEYYDIQKDSGDGFTRYSVTYDQIIYRYNDGTESRGNINNNKLDKLTEGYLVVRNSEYKRDITFTKIDLKTGHPLAGAEFALYASKADAQNDENRLQTVVGTADGIISFEDLNVGQYYIRETAAPIGYKMDDGHYHIADIQRYTSVLSTYTWNDEKVKEGAYITNEELPRADIELLKVDYTNTNNVLENAQFQLWYYNEDTETYIKVPQDGMIPNASVQIVKSNPLVTTDEDGKARFEGLFAGRYRITEETSPEGYFKLQAPIDFTVDEDGHIADAQNTMWTITTEGSGDDAVVKLTIKNRKGEELPMTGGIGTLPYIAGGMLLIAVSLMMIYTQRRRLRKEVK